MKWIARQGLTAALIATAVFLAAVSVVQADSKVKSATKSIPKDLMDVAFDISIAQEISRRCQRGFRMNRAYERAWVRELEKKYSKGRNDLLLAAASPEVQRVVQDRSIAYLKKRDVVVTVRETWCAAGRAEVSEKTRIGKLLIAR